MSKPAEVRQTSGRISAPQTMTELRDRCAEAFADCWNGYIDGVRSKELANLAGKIIKSAAVQLEYAALSKKTPKISFLEG